MSRGTAGNVRTDVALASSLRVSIPRLTRRLRIASQTDSSSSLTPSWLAVCALLSRDGERSIGELAQHERVRPPSMTQTIGCMEAEGLVTRHPHPSDGRQVVVRLTPQGAERLQAERRLRNAWLVRRLGDLTAEERDVLREAAVILERLSNS